MRLLLAGFMVFFASNAAAADAMTVNAAGCRALVTHQAADGVDFTPGVDVRGKAVVPADLGGGYGIEIPEAVDIQIGIDLADRLGLRESRRQDPGQPIQNPAVRPVLPYEGKAPIGVLTVKGGAAYWNGKRLVSQDEALLAEACRQGFAEAGIILPDPKPAVPE